MTHLNRIKFQKHLSSKEASKNHQLEIDHSIGTQNSMVYPAPQPVSVKLTIKQEMEASIKPGTSSTFKSITQMKSSLTAKLLSTKHNFTIIIKAASPYALVFLFTIIWNVLIKRNKTKCLGVGMDSVPDDCTPHAGQTWGSLMTTFIVIQVYSSGHFLFGSILLSKYSKPAKKNKLVFLNFCTFMLSHIIVLNGPIFDEKVCILFKIFFIVILNAFSFIAISKFTGHPKPFQMMKNYFYFELLTCSIPTVTVLASKMTYPLFIRIASKGNALFMTSIFNAICDFFFSQLMIKTILAENKFLENIDLMPGAYILTGYFDGLFFGNLVSQDIESFGFFVNVASYYGINFFVISGLRKKTYEYYCKRQKKATPKLSALTLIWNGSRFYSIFPMALTIFFTHLKTPYFYGSQLYDYEKFDWLIATDKYNFEKLTDIFTFQKLGVMFAFSVSLAIYGFFNRRHYVFCEVTVPIYIQNIFFTFKICTMFTIGFEYSVQVANVVDKDVIDQMLGPYWRLLQIHD